MPRSKWTSQTARNVRQAPHAVVTFAVCLTIAMNALPGVTEGKGKPTGGGNAGYAIVDLPVPHFSWNNDGETDYVGPTPAFPESISSVSSDGTTFYVVGNCGLSDDYGDRATCWTVSIAGNVVAEDLSDWLWAHDLDVNSAGIISGETNGDYADRSAALLLPNGQLIVLPGANIHRPRLNNPDQLGVFQVVGGDVLWDVSVNGTVLATTSLIDPDGTHLFARDINDFQEIAGYILVDNELVPAVGEFNSDGVLQISTRNNPNPEVIAGFWDFEIDDSGNLLGFGYEPGNSGVYPRAVVWPATGGAIDLVAEYRLIKAEGNGIASVDGAMQVVGGAGDESGRFAYLYADSELSDVEPMSAGDQPWDFSAAGGINSSGMICGFGKVGKRRNQQQHGFVLIPDSP